MIAGIDASQILFGSLLAGGRQGGGAGSRQRVGDFVKRLRIAGDVLLRNDRSTQSVGALRIVGIHLKENFIFSLGFRPILLLRGDPGEHGVRLHLNQIFRSFPLIVGRSNRFLDVVRKIGAEVVDHLLRGLLAVIEQLRGAAFTIRRQRDLHGRLSREECSISFQLALGILLLPFFELVELFLRIGFLLGRTGDIVLALILIGRFLSRRCLRSRTRPRHSRGKRHDDRNPQRHLCQSIMHFALPPAFFHLIEPVPVDLPGLKRISQIPAQWRPSRRDRYRFPVESGKCGV